MSLVLSLEMAAKEYCHQECLVKNGYGEYHLPEWIEVFRKKRRRKDCILPGIDYVLEKKYS